MLSVVPVLLKILNQLALQLWQCMTKQVKILLADTVPNSPVTMQYFASHSQETVNFNAGAFSGANVIINFYNSK